MPKQVTAAGLAIIVAIAAALLSLPVASVARVADEEFVIKTRMHRAPIVSKHLYIRSPHVTPRAERPLPPPGAASNGG